YFYQLLGSKPEIDDVNKHFLFITGGEGSSLYSLAMRTGIEVLLHPEVGGRFAVLSSVGMVPAALSGLNYLEFIRGAREMATDLDEARVEDDLALRYAIYNYHYSKLKINPKSISVLMPYSYSLRGFALWYRQLWAESLGKKLNLRGETVHA